MLTVAAGENPGLARGVNLDTADSEQVEHRQLLAGDDPEQTDVWSIACFYVHRSAWRTGVATALLAAAIEHAREHGAGAIEGYPVKPGSVDPYTGYDAMFARAGFRLVLPPLVDLGEDEVAAGVGIGIEYPVE